MSVQKQTVSFTDTAYAFAKELVEAGEYPNMSAAVSGELAKAKAERQREQSILEAELERRLSLPLDQWEPVHCPAPDPPRSLGTKTCSGEQTINR